MAGCVESWLVDVIIIYADSVGRRGYDVLLCLFVCLFVYVQHNSKTNDPKVFKLGVGNVLWISQK